MSQMTPAQARVVDPILSEHARGYRQAGMIGAALFPTAYVGAYAGQVIEFGKEAFRLYNTRRAPGATTATITQGYQGKPYSIIPSALDALVPRELMRDAAQVPGIDLGARAIDTVMRAMLLEHEYNCAQISRNAANYDAEHKLALTGTDRWTSESSNPFAVVRDAREAIRSSIGVYPNVMEISATTFSALQLHPGVIDRIKHTGRDVPSTELLANLFNVKKVVVGEAVVATGANDDFGDVWGNDTVLAYVSEGGGNAAEPSYGYTYTIEGHPLVEQPRWDDSRKSWKYGVSYDNSPVLSGMSAGFLIQGAGAPAA